MDNPFGFMEFARKEAPADEATERIKNYDEFHTPLPEREQRCQGERCMHCGVPFCQSGLVINGMISGCPLNNLIPEWNNLLSLGAMKQAYQRLKLTNPFPEFTSRVCPALCEKACTCGADGDAVTVRNNEYSIVETAYKSGWAAPNPPKVRTGKRIAVIGSGPSGLTVADRLNSRGHSVTVFERSDRIGGLLMYGIPNMKLDKSVINRRIEIMEAEGVEFRTGADIGRNISFEELKEEFDSIVLACGASNPRDIEVKGRIADGIYFAVDFLKSTTKALLDNGLQSGFISAKDKDVIVIGGGDTGNDCVATCVRHGAKSIIQLEMMPKLPEQRSPDNPWPEWPRVNKTDYGQEEAAAVYGSDPRIYQTTVKEFLSDNNGKLQGAVLTKLSRGKDGRMVPVEGSETKAEAQLILIAAGFLGSEKYVTEAAGVEADKRTNVSVIDGTHKTSVNNVYAVGDMRTGQSLVVRAIRDGIDCAREVDMDLMGYSNL